MAIRAQPVSGHQSLGVAATVAVLWTATRMAEWWWCADDEPGDARADDERARAIDRAAFEARHQARAKAKAARDQAELDLQSSRPDVVDGVSYSLGEPEAGRVMRQMRADADVARRVHGLGADDDDDD